MVAIWLGGIVVVVWLGGIVKAVWFQVFVRFGEVDSWIEDDEKTENQEMGIWESKGLFGLVEMMMGRRW